MYRPKPSTKGIRERNVRPLRETLLIDLSKINNKIWNNNNDGSKSVEKAVSEESRTALGGGSFSVRRAARVSSKAFSISPVKTLSSLRWFLEGDPRGRIREMDRELIKFRNRRMPWTVEQEFRERKRNGFFSRHTRSRIPQFLPHHGCIVQRNYCPCCVILGT